MSNLDYKKLGAQIKDVYVDKERYQLNKDVPTFYRDGKYVGDFFNFTIFELDGSNPPTFYHVFSPYDIITSKSTQQAAVFRSGELIFSSEFTPYMQQRTGVMSALVLGALGIKALKNLRVLYVGTGSIAQRDIAALKAHFPDVAEVSFVNRGDEAKEFTKIARELGVETARSSLGQIGDFDIIICHTNSKEPVVTADLEAKIKSGTIIAVFSSEDFTELAPEFFDTKVANILIDWEQTIEEALELKASVDSGRADPEKFVSLAELFSSGLPNRGRKNYTIYRSHGTPMQNLAALKLLVNDKESKV